MIDRGRHNLLGVLIHAVDYDAAVARILAAARGRQRFTVSALAVHGVMTGAFAPDHAYRLNRLDLVVPDGQPVRWALNLLHRTKLHDRVYGPELMLRICKQAAAEGLGIFLYGSTPAVLHPLARKLKERFPNLLISGSLPSSYRRLNDAEKQTVVTTVRESGAAIVLLGLGCPRQEVWAYEYREQLAMPIVAVGAAFDFHSGVARQAPPTMQRLGLEWLFRLWQEPRRLWRRYLLLNPAYVGLITMQALGIRVRDYSAAVAPSDINYG